MLRRAANLAGSSSILSKLLNAPPPSTGVLALLSHPHHHHHHHRDDPFSSQPQRRWNKKFRARELDDIWERYYARKKAHVVRDDSSGEVVPSLRTEDGHIKLDADAPNDELVAWGDFELQPFVDLIEFPDVVYDIDPQKLSDPSKQNSTSFLHVGKVLGELIRSTGVSKLEMQERTTQGRHVKRTTAKRRLKRTRKFNADQRAIRRLLWLIDRRREYEKHFDELEDDVEDPYAGTEFWMKWQQKQELETKPTDSSENNVTVIRH